MESSTTHHPVHWPISARLYLPEGWADDRARCRRVRVPESVTFAAKPEVALHLLDRVSDWGVPFATVVTDAGYGIPSFLRALDERRLMSVCAVASDFGVRVPAEMREAAAVPTQMPSRKCGQSKKPRPVARHDVQAVTAARTKGAPTAQLRTGFWGQRRPRAVPPSGSAA